LPILLLHEEVKNMADTQADDAVLDELIASASKESTETEETVAKKPDNPEVTETDAKGDSTGEKAPETTETKEPDNKGSSGIEITRERKGSLPKGIGRGLNKRFNTLNARVDDAHTERDQANSELDKEREKTRLLQMQNDQLISAKKVFSQPNPDDYAGGTYDDDYERDSTNVRIKEEISKQVAESTKDLRDQDLQQKAEVNLRKNQDFYYSKVDKMVDELEIGDFDATEEIAIKAIGLEAVNSIINTWPEESAQLIYFFGSNAEESKTFKRLFDENKALACSEIGGILAEIKVTPKSETTPLEPDEEIVGGSASKIDMLQKQVDKWREKSMAGNPKAMERVLQIKKDAKAKGILLE